LRKSNKILYKMNKIFRTLSVIVFIVSAYSCKKEVDNPIVDADGNIYTSVKIGTQVWMAENLKTTKYRNGDLIGTTDPASKDLSQETAPKYQWAPRAEELLVAVYSRLYSWYAVTDSRNLCPAGWHVPSDAEFTVLTDYLISTGYGIDGSGPDIAKSMASKTGWTTVPAAGEIGNNESNNSSGFTAIPGGYRYDFKTFTDIGYICHWWTSSEYDSDKAISVELHYSGSEIWSGPDNKRASAYSVRCLKD
jgi:uncharacterized protein (TIGR02145 family)